MTPTPNSKAFGELLDAYALARSASHNASNAHGERVEAHNAQVAARAAVLSYVEGLETAVTRWRDHYSKAVERIEGLEKEVERLTWELDCVIRHGVSAAALSSSGEEKK